MRAAAQAMGPAPKRLDQPCVVERVGRGDMSPVSACAAARAAVSAHQVRVRHPQSLCALRDGLPLGGALDERVFAARLDEPLQQRTRRVVVFDARPHDERACHYRLVWHSPRALNFGIFDAFTNEAGRQADLSGKVAAAALMAQASELFSEPPSIQSVDVLAATLLG